MGQGTPGPDPVTLLQAQLNQQAAEMNELRTLNVQLQDRLTNVLAATEATLASPPEPSLHSRMADALAGAAATAPGTRLPPHMYPVREEATTIPTARTSPLSGNGGRYNIKLKEPTEYRGNPGSDPREWIADIRDYIGFHVLRGPPMSENEKVLIAATYLSSHAKRRWVARRTSLEKLHAQDPNHPALQFTLEQFLEWIGREFKDVNREEKDRLSYTQCTQGPRNVAQYVTDFLAKAALVEPYPSDMDMRDRFKDGLSPDMKREMARVRPQPVLSREYMETAEQLDASIRAAERPERNRQPITGYRRFNNPERGSGGDTGRRPGPHRDSQAQLHALDEHEYDEESDGDDGGSDVQHEDGPPPVTDEQLAALASELQCYQCKEMGHIARNCTKRSKSRRGSGKGQGRT
ncbi:hypothetical protein V8E36_005490 [Tilletia maclaganii]